MDDVELGRAIGRGDWADPAEPVEVAGVVAAVGRRRRRRRWAAVAGTGVACAAAASVVLVAPSVPSAEDAGPADPAATTTPPIEDLTGKDVADALGLPLLTSPVYGCSMAVEFGNGMYCLADATDDRTEQRILAMQISGYRRTSDLETWIGAEVFWEREPRSATEHLYLSPEWGKRLQQQDLDERVEDTGSPLVCAAADLRLVDDGLRAFWHSSGSAIQISNNGFAPCLLPGGTTFALVTPEGEIPVQSREITRRAQVLDPGQAVIYYFTGRSSCGKQTVARYADTLRVGLGGGLGERLVAAQQPFGCSDPWVVYSEVQPTRAEVQIH